MYTPAHFRLEDRAKLTAVIQANSFATLTTRGPDGLIASHLPFLYDEGAGPDGTLFAHMARANVEQTGDPSALRLAAAMRRENPA